MSLIEKEYKHKSSITLSNAVNHDIDILKDMYSAMTVDQLQERIIQGQEVEKRLQRMKQIIQK